MTCLIVALAIVAISPIRIASRNRFIRTSIRTFVSRIIVRMIFFFELLLLPSPKSKPHPFPNINQWDYLTLRGWGD